jgi:hypothetical protein
MTAGLALLGPPLAVAAIVARALARGDASDDLLQRI